MPQAIGLRQRWLSARAFRLHLTLAVVAPGCLYAGWWQVGQATAGNGLSYLYAVEWPIFAIFAVVMWWNLLHDDPEAVGTRGLRRAAAAPDQARPAGAGAPARRLEDEDPELAAYNAYLASLAAADRAKSRVAR